MTSIESIARNLVAARAEARRLKLLCASLVCLREAAAYEAADNTAHTPRPCWKPNWEDYDRETGGGGEWYPDVEPDEWCEPCKAREVARLQLKRERRRAAGLLSALAGAVRRSP